MPINEWKGAAVAVSEVLRVQVVEAIAGAVYQPFPTLAITHQATDTDTVLTIAASLEQQLIAARLWTVQRAGATLTLTGFAGIPSSHARAGSLSAVPAPRSSVSRIRAGVLAIAQQTDITLPDTTTGGTWSLSANFGTGVETASSLAWNITPAALATALNGLATPGASDVTVELRNSTKEYRITWGGSLAGTTVTVTADGSALLGNVTTLRQQATRVGQHVDEVQAIYLSTNTSPTGLKLVYTGMSGAGVDLGNSVTATTLSTAIQTLLSLTAADIQVTRHVTQHGQLFVIILTGAAKGQSWPVVFLRGQPGQFAPGVRVQSATGGEQNEIQLAIDGGAVPSNTSTRSHLGIYDGSIPQGYFETFIGTDGEQNHPLGSEMLAVLNGAPAPNEAWYFGHDGVGGTFTITYSGQTTGNLDWDATPAEIVSALEALSNLGTGDVGVTGVGSLANPWRVEFKGAVAQTDVTDPTWTTSALTGGKPITGALARAAAAGINELQALTVDLRASGGTLRVGFRGDLSTAQDHNATSSTWQTALQALSTIGSGNCTVSGTPARLLVEFTGDLGQRPVDLLVVQDSALTLSAQPVLNTTVLTRATGPNHWNNAGNWTLSRVPQTSDTVVLQAGVQPIQHGLLQRATVAITEDADVFTCPDHDFVFGQIVRADLDDYSATLNGSAVTITASTNLYVVGTGTGSLQLSTSATGNPLVWTAAAVGTIAVQLTRLLHRNGVQIGWPRIRTTGEWETLPRFLAIDFATSTEDEPALDVACSSSLVCIDAGESPLRARVLDTGSGSVPALQLLVNNASAARLDVLGGEVAVAHDPDQSAALLSVRCTGGEVQLGQVQYQHLLEHAPGQVMAIRTSHAGSAVQVAKW